MSTAHSYNLVLAIQDVPKPIELDVPETATVADILEAVRKKTGRDDLVELAFEDDDESLDDKDQVIDSIRREFRVLHASTRQRVNVTLKYEGQSRQSIFRPNTTIRRVIKWAISDEGFSLEGKPAEFQIKVEDRILPPDSHVGQAANGKSELSGVLVHNVKPQG
jgi:hypothetical protein